jgi:hypothetical protein
LLRYNYRFYEKGIKNELWRGFAFAGESTHALKKLYAAAATAGEFCLGAPV